MCVGGWMDVCRWMDGCVQMDGWMRVGGWMDECVCVHGCMDGSMDECVQIDDVGVIRNLIAVRIIGEWM